MPVASPQLNNVLIRWFDRGNDMEREISVRLDHLMAVRQRLDDFWSIQVEQRRRAVKEEEKHEQTGDARWNERLRRLEGWQTVIANLTRECAGMETTMNCIRWFEGAERLSHSMARRLSHRAARLQDQVLDLRSQLEQWNETLTQRQWELNEFKERAGASHGPLLVSRARKQPDVEYVAQQIQNESDLGSGVRALRRAVNHYLGRLYKAGKLLEKNALVYPGLLEIKKNQILEDLKEPYRLFFALREQILTEALHYEAGRQKLRWIQDTVKTMRCVEDVYKSPEPVWKKWFAGIYRQKNS